MQACLLIEGTEILELAFLGTSPFMEVYISPRGLEKIDTAAVFLLVLNIKKKGDVDLHGESQAHVEVWEVFLTLYFMQEIHSHTFSGQTASLQ